MSHPLLATGLDRWICWALVPDPTAPKPRKVPTHPQTGHPVDPTDPRQWMTYPMASTWATHAGLNLGYVFAPGDGLFFLDLDDCLGPDGQWQAHALHVLSQFPGAAIEVSVSGRGLHVFGRFTGALEHSNKNRALRMELYTRDRFCAIGTQARGDVNTDHTAVLQSMAAQLFPPRAGLDDEWTDGPCEGYTGAFDDAELVRRALRSETAATAFGAGASFKALWEADADVLGQAFPSSSGQSYDASSADLALASRLAFWTGKDCARIERLMLESGLRRDKWDARPEYLQGTIIRAVSGCQQVYSRVEGETTLDGAPASIVYDETTGIATIDGYPYVAPDKLKEQFAGYVWVESVDRILSPDGRLLDESRFKKRHHARVYALDHTNTKTTTNAHKAFTESQCFDFPQANELCFHPNNHERIIKADDGTLRANIWTDPKVKRVAGDPAPLLRHIRKLLPNGDDAETVLAYMAACVQHQDHKFTWCVLLQGVQGCGKSLLTQVLSKAIGDRYTHVLKGAELTKDFNGWLSKSIVVVVEDLFISDSRSWMLEKIKPMITAEYLQIERKGIDQTMEYNCANFILTTNHKDAIPLDANERRFCILYCAQQKEEHLARDGLTGQYFDGFFRWLNTGGYAICAEYLATCEIPDHLNPATACTRAPKSSSYREALNTSQSVEAQIILEAIEAEEPGLRGGWLSSLSMVHILERRGVRQIAPRKLGKIAGDLGFVFHPQLSGGRASHAILSEGGRPKLYILDGHPAMTAQDPTREYERCQGYTPKE